MRKVLLLTSVIAASTHVAEAGMPAFNNTGSTPAATQASESSSGWKLPRLWGKKETAPDPQFFYQAPAPEPTTSQKLTSVFTDNAAVRTARNWMGSDETAAPAPAVSESLSLNQPAVRPTPQLMISMAQMHEQRGNVPQARQTYQQALAAAPKNVHILRELGHFEDRQNRLADAERYYTEASRLAPQNAAVLNDLGLCLARQNKLAPSAQVLERAIALKPQKALYRNNMATVLMEMGEQHQAMQHLMAVHAPAAAYYNMGHLLEKGGHQEAALAHYAEALQLDPSLTAAESALAALAPEAETTVPQTAMVTPTTGEPSFGPRQEWPSEPIRPAAPAQASAEPSFGPRLLPQVD